MDDLGIVEKRKVLIQRLLKQEQQMSKKSLFQDDIFETTCRKIRNKDETRVIRNISLLIVPSVEILVTYGASELASLNECVNEGWNTSIPVNATLPQPADAEKVDNETVNEQPLCGPRRDRQRFDDGDP